MQKALPLNILEKPKELPNYLKIIDDWEEKPLAEKNSITDSELFIKKAFEESPEKGCELLFRRYYKVLCSHAVRFVYSKEIAEDLVSDVFCKLWKNKSYQSITSSYRLYLFRCVRNESYNYLRLEFHHTTEIDLANSQESPVSQRPDNIMQFEEVFKQVESLVESLPPQCRSIFLMNRFEGKKYQEIAKIQQLSVKTVEAHISKALGIIRKGLKEHWMSP
jgi:RNA polymerase sigma-70 factor (family 1)